MSAPSCDLPRCGLCGLTHQAVRLRPGERALCSECGATLERGTFSTHAASAFTLTALVLAVPAVLLPLVSVSKFGATHSSYLWTGAQRLWETGMPLLSVWVALCGLAVPLALIGTLTGCLLARRLPEVFGAAAGWERAARALQHWSMPEVHVLAVLIAFTKIGVLVDVSAGAGLWFYAAMTVATLLAWRSTELREVG